MEIKYGIPPKAAVDLTNTESRLKRVEYLKNLYKTSVPTNDG